MAILKLDEESRAYIEVSGIFSPCDFTEDRLIELADSPISEFDFELDDIADGFVSMSIENCEWETVLFLVTRLRRSAKRIELKWVNSIQRHPWIEVDGVDDCSEEPFAKSMIIENGRIREYRELQTSMVVLTPVDDLGYLDEWLDSDTHRWWSSLPIDDCD